MFHATLKVRAAESLIETLVAITVIAITTTAALSLIRNSLVGNEVIGEKLIALNLAEETLEAVRNIRDTNALRFSGDLDECWNVINVDDIADCSTPENKIQEGVSYALERVFVGSMPFSWTLNEVIDPDEDGWMDVFTYTIDLDQDGSEEFMKIYAQSGLSVPGLTLVRERAFKRILTIEEWTDRDAFDATVTVEWEVGGNLKSLSLTRTIAKIH